MKVRTKVKAGGISLNHNEALLRKAAKTVGLKVRTNIKAGSGGSDMPTESLS